MNDEQTQPAFEPPAFGGVSSTTSGGGDGNEIEAAARRLIASIDPERIELHPAQRIVWDELAALVADDEPEDDD